MANLLIADAGLPLSATAVTVSKTANASYPVTNLFSGNKADYFSLATASSGDTLVTLTSTGTANFLYLGGANTLKAGGVGTITVRRHSANSYAAATAVTTVSSFGSATLYGPHADDHITTFTTTASSAYWFVNFNAAAASRIQHAKLFLGNYFDPGIDPNQPVSVVRTRPTAGRRKPLYTFTLSWQGMAYAKAVTLYSRYYRNRRHNAVVLFTTGYHGILLDHRILFCRIVEMSAPPRATDYCNVSMTVEEQL